MVPGTDELLDRLAQETQRRGIQIAAAESLTSGAISSRLGAAPDASEWFAGGVVAYREPVKFGVLGVREGPVVCAECAEQMATGVRRLLDADVAVAATGVGGPGPSEDQPPGTVFLAVATADGAWARELHLPGDPEDVIQGAVDAAVVFLWDVVGGSTPATG